MLRPLGELPLRESGVTTVASHRQQRCDLRAAGHIDLAPGSRYRFDNAQRAHEDCCVLQVTVAGCGMWRDASGHEERLEAGEGFLTALPSDSAYWLPPGQGWRFCYLYFDGDLARYHVDEIVHRRGHRFRIGDHYPLTLAMTELLRAVFDRRGDAFTISALLYACLMQAHPRPQQIDEPDGITRARRFAQQAFADRNLGVEQLAEQAGMSRFHFSRLFKRSCGITPYAWLIELRIRKALELLAQSGLPAAEIAVRVGFNDYPYFCNAFKKHVGTTPKRFRDRVRDGGEHTVI